MAERKHAVEQFRECLGECDCYPEGVVRVPEYIGGTAALSLPKTQIP